eukprot:TRINITY_DN1891_c0_g1_i4.p3 TRINITY_DN1891_c0_g1~~TRINITY_DN1891_c0_g1_i4.p3  ORF type:complete len:111 (-),score=31.26 TRINITY_DN1891_c0_g1_i4:247-579(-)
MGESVVVEESAGEDAEEEEIEEWEQIDTDGENLSDSIAAMKITKSVDGKVEVPSALDAQTETNGKQPEPPSLASMVPGLPEALLTTLVRGLRFLDDPLSGLNFALASPCL